MKKVTYFLPGFSPDEERFLERHIYQNIHIHTCSGGGGFFKGRGGGGFKFSDLGVYKDNVYVVFVVVFAMINCEKMAHFCFVFIAMVYENYKFFLIHMYVVVV